MTEGRKTDLLTGSKLTQVSSMATTPATLDREQQEKTNSQTMNNNLKPVGQQENNNRQ